MSSSDEALGLQFPCRFPIKVMGKQTASFRPLVADIVNRHVMQEHQISLSERSSKAARYLSITITIEAQNRQQLDDLYRQLSGHPDIMMVL